MFYFSRIAQYVFTLFSILASYLIEVLRFAASVSGLQFESQTPI